MNIIKENINKLLSDKPEIINVIIDIIQDRIETLGKKIETETTWNSFIGDCIIRGNGVIKIGRSENMITIGGHGNDTLDQLEIIHLPVNNLPKWNRDWNSKIENRWLDIFSKGLKEDEETNLLSLNGNTSYQFKLSNDRIYYSKIFGNLNIAGGVFIYTPHTKLITREHGEKILFALES